MSAEEPEDETAWLEEMGQRFTKAAKAKRAFLRAWAGGATWREASAEAGVSYATPSGWTLRDPAFAEARAVVEQAIADRHEAALDALASGEPGTQVQLNALALRLRALRPGRYRDTAQRVEVTGAGGGAVRIEDEGSATRAVELLARFAAAARSRPALPDPAQGEVLDAAALPEVGQPCTEPGDG